MALTHEEITAIKNEVIAECKNIFVQIDDCIDKQQSINNKFANDDKRIDILIGEFGVFKKLLWTIATSSIGALVIAFFNLILK